MQLTNKQKKSLKGQAHHLKPVITIGAKGLSESVVAETDQALSRHELIKIKVPAIDKTDKSEMLQLLVDQCKASLLGLTGRTAIVFRQNPKDKTRFQI